MFKLKSVQDTDLKSEASILVGCHSMYYPSGRLSFNKSYRNLDVSISQLTVENEEDMQALLSLLADFIRSGLSGQGK